MKTDLNIAECLVKQYHFGYTRVTLIAAFAYIIWSDGR
jgi:hypothetical protein